ncbi:hypothetical protein [Aestuariimicrobium sp. T2.26MG-19.2B]|uniref:hypothetical protein n=1 Tax=Aestuariimicrobium sp. T2.26MG-19.2B TaxID=3040679 RepID=UPI002477A623|nr:hypothetical protein [Aestuariimicrobium sp. T2.26MG-19.2B]CAI9401143.1 hypothetical protein AESSP_00533 [Aestuariimicrobium sp. T2.26MG-19.2B]
MTTTQPSSSSAPSLPGQPSEPTAPAPSFQASTQQASHSIRTLAPVAVADRIGLGRLVRVELRKFLDTRAGMFLLGIALLGALAVAVALAIFYRQFSDVMGNTVWSTPSSFIALPINLLVPVMVILLFTQEWGQRTTLTTFAIEPRRGRILAAKGAVALAITVVGWLLTQGLSVVSSAAGAALTQQTVDWTNDATTLLGLAATFVLSNAMAAGFGLLLMNTPAAIVTYMALPNLLGAVGLLGSNAQSVMNWIDLNRAALVLYSDQPVHLGWWKLTTAVVLWVVVPIVIGVVRNLRREAK